jgi:hypothetical protein
MPRKTTARHGTQSHIQTKAQELERQAEKIKAELLKTRAFLDKAPELIADVQRKEHRERIARYEQPPRLDGPGDFRLELVSGRSSKPTRLRKERSKAPLVTLVLVVGFAFVAYYAWRVLWNG